MTQYHRERQDGRQSPAEVLGWVSGVLRPPDQLDRIFYATRFGRRLDRAGYVRFRHWRLYGEMGLARRRAVVWLYKETLTIEFAEEPLSQFTVDYQPDRRHLRQVRHPRRFETRYQSPATATVGRQRGRVASRATTHTSPDAEALTIAAGTPSRATALICMKDIPSSIG